MKRFTISKILCIAAMALSLASCTSVNSKVGGLLDLDTDLKLSFVVDKNVNPDDNKVSSPLIVRMYELKSTKAFENANFIDLYERDADVLGKTMITQQSLKPIQPNEDISARFVLSKGTKYIGLYAEFLQYEDAKYKVIIPVAETNIVSSTAKVQLIENKMIILK
ncbi:type VI secretion system lipoprotein TssJ [Colwellia psychrerythraea]|uniref:Type VI secretion lipoprotein, VC_A0113 family n=1 Tax=Colwellia psychrerythraea TaxID=28229 RepID=A0A099KY45_COLPS|nr:type VI secretion system lipoprotein TssJ [Colwellia psychrerythraea]KGJ94812.1 type VI secretion lipoprotein, VC_A0113 family [Colwellia psychrerythraea]